MTQQPVAAPQGYERPPWVYVRPTNAKAILAISLLSIPPAAIIFGILARREIRRTGEAGWGLATWGMGIGIAIVALDVLFIGLYVLVAMLALAGSFAGPGGGLPWQ